METLPAEIWHHIANFTNINNLLKLEKALNIDLSYVARNLHKQQYKSVINDINRIEYYIEILNINCGTYSVRTYNRYSVSYYSYQLIPASNTGYYFNHSDHLEIGGDRYNVKGLILLNSMYVNRSLSAMKSVKKELTNTIIIYHEKRITSITGNNDEYDIIYPW